ncbi:hypothetical protein BACEGG_01654 [Bacteroides eggerthii DSM 20697]|nr:hypothetical protein BACEGG_01654 [Bacteroides eggerthii DSM 20697]
MKKSIVSIETFKIYTYINKVFLYKPDISFLATTMFSTQRSYH